MNIELGLTQGAVNTQYAPLGAIIWHYEQSQRLKPLEEVLIPIKTRDYSPASKLKQVLYSILAGCEYLVEVNSRLKAEKGLAQISGLAKFSDQATLSRTLDAVTLMNIEQLRRAGRWLMIGGPICGLTSIYQACLVANGPKKAAKAISAVKKRDWPSSGAGQCHQIWRNHLV